MRRRSSTRRELELGVADSLRDRYASAVRGEVLKQLLLGAAVVWLLLRD
jgi:hypothetical protein